MLKGLQQAVRARNDRVEPTELLGLNRDLTPGLLAAAQFSECAARVFAFHVDQDEEGTVSISISKWSLRYSFGVKP
jgi:hypothetical protein